MPHHSQLSHFNTNSQGLLFCATKQWSSLEFLEGYMQVKAWVFPAQCWRCRQPPCHFLVFTLHYSGLCAADRQNNTQSWLGSFRKQQVIKAVVHICEHILYIRDEGMNAFEWRKRFSLQPEFFCSAAMEPLIGNVRMGIWNWPTWISLCNRKCGRKIMTVLEEGGCHHLPVFSLKTVQTARATLQG